MFLVFEKLGCSLYHFLKKNHYAGFPLAQVRDFAAQLLQAVDFCHSIRLIHTDLKLENILLVDHTCITKDYNGNKVLELLNTGIRLIDFGGATLEREHHAAIINTRQYRAPEVILGLLWSYPSDLWSIGCILVELITGELLFSTHDDVEHLALMEKTLEIEIPYHMMSDAVYRFRDRKRRSRSRSRDRHAQSQENPSRDRSSSCARPDLYVDFETKALLWPQKCKDDESYRHVKQQKPLRCIIEDPGLRDFLSRILHIDPERRMTTQEALRHPFIRGSR